MFLPAEIIVTKKLCSLYQWHNWQDDRLNTGHPRIASLNGNKFQLRNLNVLRIYRCRSNNSAENPFKEPWHVDGYISSFLIHLYFTFSQLMHVWSIPILKINCSLTPHSASCSQVIRLFWEEITADVSDNNLHKICDKNNYIWII